MATATMAKGITLACPHCGAIHDDDTSPGRGPPLHIIFTTE
jgi:hypothetical protein